MEDRAQYIENIKSYIISEDEYSAISLVNKALEQNQKRAEVVKTDFLLVDLRQAYSYYASYNKEMKSEHAARMVDLHVRESVEKANKNLNEFKEQLEHFKNLLSERPDVLSDEDLETIREQVQKNAELLNKPLVDVVTLEKQLLEGAHVRKVFQDVKLVYQTGAFVDLLTPGLYPDQKGTMEGIVVRHDINQAVEKLGGHFSGLRAQVDNQGDKEAIFITFPQETDALRKAESVKTAMAHGLSPAFRGIADGLEVRVINNLESSHRPSADIHVLYKREQQVGTLVDALNQTAEKFEAEAQKKQKAEAQAKQDIEDNEALMRAMDEAINKNPKEMSGLQKVLYKATTLSHLPMPALLMQEEEVEVLQQAVDGDELIPDGNS